MLKSGFIKDTVNKATFSEQCYYTFGGNDSNLSEGKIEFYYKKLKFDFPAIALKISSGGFFRKLRL